MTHFVEEELRRTFAAHDPGSGDDGGEILAAVTRRAGRARHRRIAVAGTLVVVAATGVVVPQVWPGGGASGLSTNTAPSKPATGDHKAPDSEGQAQSPALHPLALPADIPLPLSATSVPAGYGPFAPVADEFVGLGMLSESTRGSEILVTVGASRPRDAVPAGAALEHADVSGRSADLYRTATQAVVIWRREAGQWVAVLAESKNPLPSAPEEALQVARGLADPTEPARYEPLFTLGPDRYRYAISVEHHSLISQDSAIDSPRQISADLRQADPSGLPAGWRFDYHGHTGVLHDGDRVADVDLGDGHWLEVTFGPGVTLAPGVTMNAQTRALLVRNIVITGEPAS